MPLCPKCGREHEDGAPCAETNDAALASTALPVAVAPTPPRRRWVIVVVATVVLILAAIAFALMRLGGERVELATAAPADSELWLEIDARPTTSRLAKWAPVIKAAADSDLGPKLTELLKRGLEGGDVRVDWSKDLKPWLGPQAALAMAKLSPSGPTPWGTPALPDPTILILATVRSDRTAESALADLTKQCEQQWGWPQAREETREGVTLHLLGPTGAGAAEGLVYAVRDEMLFASTRADTVVAAVKQREKPASSLAHAGWFTRLAAKAPKDPVLFLAFSPGFGRAAADLAAAGLPAKEKPAAPSWSAESGVWADLDGQGVTFSCYGFYAKDVIAAQDRTELARLAGEDVWEEGFNAVPKGAWLAGSMHGFPLFAQALKRGGGPAWEEARQEVLRTTHLDLNADLLGWMEGATVAGLLPGTPMGDPELVLEVRGKPGEDVSARARKLQQILAKATPSLKVVDTKLEATPAVHLASPDPGLSDLCYTASGDSLLLGSSSGALARALRARKDPPQRISAQPAWQQAKQRIGHGKGAVGACYLEIAPLAGALQPMAGMLGEAGTRTLALTKGIPWIAFAVRLEDTGAAANGQVSLDYPVLFKGVADLLDLASPSQPKPPRNQVRQPERARRVARR